jgi:putative addiction module CopG family antidote
MRNTQQFSVTLPEDMAHMVKTKVLSGEYASESEVFRDGLRALQARDKTLDHWLRTEVAGACDKLKDDPSRALSVEQVRGHLADKRKRAASA